MTFQNVVFLSRIIFELITQIISNEYSRLFGERRFIFNYVPSVEEILLE